MSYFQKMMQTDTAKEVEQVASAGSGYFGKMMASMKRDTTQGRTVVPKPLKASAGMQEAMDFFGNKYGRHIAAGIVGNLMVESGNFDPNVISGKRRGDGGKAFGVAQWHPDRQANFRKAFGKDIVGSTLKEQLHFIEWELNNTESRAKKKLLQAKTAEEAAHAFDVHYERSSGEHRQRRMSEAKKLFGM
jgi:hypothetical protein